MMESTAVFANRRLLVRPAAPRLSLGVALQQRAIQTLLVYFVVRDLIVWSTLSSHAFNFLGTPAFRGGMLLLLAAIVVRGSRRRGLRLSKQTTIIGSMILGSQLLFLCTELVLGELFTSFRAPLIAIFDGSLTVGAVVLAYGYAMSTIRPREALRFVLAPYVYFSLIASFLGVLAWMAVHTGVVDPAAWTVSPEAFPKGQGYGNVQVYTFPWYAGFVLVGSQGSFGGFDFFRNGGLFAEPTFFAFVTIPALFALPFVWQDRSRFWLGVFFLLLVTSIFTAFAVAGLIVLAAVGSMAAVRLAIASRRTKYRFAGLATAILIGTVVIIGLSFPGTFGGKLGAASEDGTFDDPFGIESVTGWLGYPALHSPDSAFEDRPRGGISALSQNIHFFLQMGFAVGLMLSRSRLWYIGGAVLVTTLYALKQYEFLGLAGISWYWSTIAVVLLAHHWRRAALRTQPSRTPPL